MTTTLANQMEEERGFVCEKACSSGIFGVFEDDGETGYLYIYEPTGKGVLNHLHIYDRHTLLDVKEADVEIVWSVGCEKCAVMIWGKYRGIINVKTMQEGRVWLETRQTPGIADKAWLSGFK